MKRPAFQFYPADWRKDMALQSCSVAARGLWIDMLCIAHECEPYGHLTVNGKPMTAAQIGRHTGLTEREAKRLIAELDDAGVASRTDEGVIYSRRMVRDEDIRNRRAEGGKAGSEHGIKGAEHGAKGGRPAKERGVPKPPLEPPPSSSSSASAYSEAKASDAVPASPAPPPTPKDRVFAFGLPLLTAAGVADKNARSMLAGLCKRHGDEAVADAIDRCAQQQALEPVSWLQAALASTVKPARQAAANAGPEWARQRDAAVAAYAGPFAAKPVQASITEEIVDVTARRVG